MFSCYYIISGLFPVLTPQHFAAVDQQDDCQDNDRNDDHILQHVREDCCAVQTAAEQSRHIVLKGEEQRYQRRSGHEDDRDIQHLIVFVMFL